MNAAPDTIDQYIQAFSPEIQAVLEEVRRTVLRSVPGGQERISYRMPAVFKDGVVVVYYRGQPASASAVRLARTLGRTGRESRTSTAGRTTKSFNAETSALPQGEHHRTGVRHNFGGEFRHERHSKEANNSESTRTSMGGKVQRGLDYTPLFRFLISKIGQDWSEIHSEAVSRLDREEPIYWLVAKSRDKQRDFVCVSESSFFSGLFVDQGNRLQAVNPRLNESSIYPYCKCCTHTFNGIRFTKAFDPSVAGAYLPSTGAGAGAGAT